ncbi:cuticle protein 16.8-like [Galendromus occidentalis]|uniref:Cuticle protein 16.8-like n=1 Tax=Galendromus occidentalis TaxID=34638 RepID=A0AAJ6QW67_9ACAR|nr:cuticle protein 16.8-like [Galendromus occidentalis]
MAQRVLIFALSAVYCARAAFVAPAPLAYGPAPVAVVPGAQPYSFGYDTRDEFGTRQTRSEVSNAAGAKIGSYGYTDPHGIYRQVNYIADGAGFRASISTNEPGTSASATGSALYNAPTTYVAPRPVAPIAPLAVAPAPLALAPAPLAAAPAPYLAPHQVHYHG